LILIIFDCFECNIRNANYNIFGVLSYPYVTNAKFSSIALQQLNAENNATYNAMHRIMHNNIKYFKFDNINDVIEFLYSKKIFMYDEGGDAIII
jgi:hypothetical protein